MNDLISGLSSHRLLIAGLVAAAVLPVGSSMAIAASSSAASAARSVTSAASSSAPSNTGGQPAVWVPYHVMVVYDDLPKAYTCDTLWHKVGDILRAVGAWKYVSITPYACKPETSDNGRAPQLEVRFLTLRTLSPRDAHWAEAHAVSKTVTLEAGAPASLAAGDCELLRQTNDNLLSVVSDVHVVDQHLQCAERPAANRYSLSVQTLQAAPPPAVRG